MNIPTPPSLRPITATDTDLPEWAEETTGWYLDAPEQWTRQIAVRRGPDQIIYVSAFQDRASEDSPIVTSEVDVEIRDYFRVTRQDLAEIAQGCRDLQVILKRIEGAPMD